MYLLIYDLLLKSIVRIWNIILRTKSPIGSNVQFMRALCYQLPTFLSTLRRWNCHVYEKNIRWTLDVWTYRIDRNKADPRWGFREIYISYFLSWIINLVPCCAQEFNKSCEITSWRPARLCFLSGKWAGGGLYSTILQKKIISCLF